MICLRDVRWSWSGSGSGCYKHGRTSGGEEVEDCAQGGLGGTMGPNSRLAQRSPSLYSHLLLHYVGLGAIRISAKKLPPSLSSPRTAPTTKPA
jgi:hypothetical protein